MGLADEALHRGRLSTHLRVLGHVGISQTLGGLSVLIPPLGLMQLLRSPVGIEALLELCRIVRPFNAFALAGVIPWFLTWLVLNRVVRANAGMKDALNRLQALRDRLRQALAQAEGK